jgi:hypothetical protein
MINPNTIVLPTPKCVLLSLSNSPLQAIVDEEDFERANQYSWSLSTKGYVQHHPRGDILIHLHNFILDVPASSGVDHKDRNKLNNSKYNLRIVSNSIQGQNRDRFKNNTSGYKGVSWSCGKEKWQVSIKVDYKQKHLGYFTNIVEAAMAYDKAAREFFGPTAFQNFPQEGGY